MPTLIHKKQIIGRATDTAGLIHDTVGWTCKNILKNTGLETVVTNGITFTLDADMQVHAVGTASANAYYTINEALLIQESDSYVISGVPAGSAPGNFSYAMQYGYVGEPSSIVYSDGATVQLTAGRQIYVNCYIKAGSTVDVIFEPMIRKSAYKDTSYEPNHLTVEEELALIESGITGESIMYTMLASNWEDDIYSFESQYPSDQYDIDIEPNGDVITKTQYQSWSKANIVGMLTGNKCKALGSVPSENIPIILKMVRKS